MKGTSKILTFLIALLLLLGTAVVVNATATNIINIKTTVTVIPAQPSQINETIISGHIIDDESKTGLSGWTVRLTGVTGKGRTTKVITLQTTSDSNGFYKFDNLSAGNYQIVLKLKPSYIPVGSMVLYIPLSTNQKSENNNFRVIDINEYINRIIHGHQFGRTGIIK